MRRIVVTSASGANGDGYGALLCFSADGRMEAELFGFSLPFRRANLVAELSARRVSDSPVPVPGPG
jgi:hypothetical protein